MALLQACPTQLKDYGSAQTIQQAEKWYRIVHFCHATMKEVLIRLENPCHAEDPPSCLVKTRPSPEKNSPETPCSPTIHTRTPLSVGLGYTLQLVLLLDSVGVAASLGSVDQLLSKAFGNALDVAE